MNYKGKYTGEEIDSLLTQVQEGKEIALIHEALEGKADESGAYPRMSVGFSEHLVGHGESSSAEFSFRASGGKSILDGTARVKELRGNTVVWNQKLGDASWDIQFDTEQIDKIKNGATYIISFEDFSPKEAGKTGYAYMLMPYMPFYAHKYLFIAEAQGDYIQYIKCGVFDGSQYQFIGQGRIDNTPLCAYFHTFNNDFVGVYVRFDVEVGLDNYAKANTICMTPRVYDLTQMFGAGNEPSTIEDFYARIPIGVDMDAYDEGMVIPFTADAIKSVGDNAWNKDTAVRGYVDDSTGVFTTHPESTTVVDLIRCLPNEEYYCNKVIHYTQKAAFHFFNENMEYIGIDGIWDATTNLYSSGKITTPSNARYMLVGTAYTTVNECMVTLVHSGWKVEVNNEYKPYEVFTREIDPRIKAAFPNGMNKWDKVYNKEDKGYIVKGTQIRAYEEGDSASDIMITDGKITIFKLVNPTIVEYEEPFNLDYEVWDFGTEEIIGSEPSAPISANIVYGFNATDTIRTNAIAVGDHEARIAQLEAMIATLQARLVNSEEDTL